MTTVAQLIEHLKQFPSDAIVVTDNQDNDICRTINLSETEQVRDGFFNTVSNCFVPKTTHKTIITFAPSNSQQFLEQAYSIPKKIVVIKSFQLD